MLQRRQCKNMRVGFHIAAPDIAALPVGLKHLLWVAAVSSAAQAQTCKAELFK